MLVPVLNAPIYPYMAPELFSKGLRGTPVGLMIEVFGQERVWRGLNGPQIMQKVCGTFVCAPMQPSVAHLPPSISEVCETCCDLEPTKRPSITVVIEMIKKKMV